MLRPLILAAALAASLSLSASAEPWWPVGSPAQSDYDRAYAALKADPGNPTLLAAFAAVATRIGNYEAAIGVLEAILLQRPELERVRVELGIMYYRVGAYDVSRFHLEKALSSGVLPADVARRAQSFLDVDERRLDGTEISGYLSVGLRWDSNPTLVTDSSTLLINDFEVPNDGIFETEDDFSGFAQGYVLWREDLGNQYGETWDTSALAYWRFQFQETKVNVGYNKLTTGPRLVLFPGKVDNLHLRPYAEATLSLVEQDFANATFGSGATLSKRFGKSVTLLADGKARYRLSDEGDEEGLIGETRVIGFVALTEDILVGLGGRWILTEADADFRSSNAWVIEGQVQYRYDAPFQLTDYPWELALHAETRWVNYDGVNPEVSLSADRDDNDTRLVLRNTVGLSASWLLFVEGGAQWVNSTIDNYDFDNYYAAAGATWRF